MRDPEDIVTVTLQIGNSDNGLSQVEWSLFCSDFESVVRAIALGVHFSGGSEFNRPWQNACIVCDVRLEELASLRTSLAGVARRWRQDSIAMSVGETEFIKPPTAERLPNA